MSIVHCPLSIVHCPLSIVKKMPKRTDINTILIIGSGPIVIGQACEFDYSGTQACRALKEEGYRIVLVNSNPATIMTDPATAHRIYIEPLTLPYLENIIISEKPEALLATLGGQTALNLATQLWEAGILQKHGVELLGASIPVIQRAESRQTFKEIAQGIGLETARSYIANNMEQALQYANQLGYPCVVRPSYTLGGTGGGIAETPEQLEQIARLGLSNSIITEILIEESLIGWKEFELEVIRDLNDNAIVVCAIENLDPMGVHTGDSITVAPTQTLTDREYQKMRTAALNIVRAIGVETGGCNVQFALHPLSRRMIIIEINPRVSRSSALASKATGYSIAKVAAKLAVGYTLDELTNDITRKNACFEPTLDYCVVKIPRFDFRKFPENATTLGTSMKAVGEIMAIGRTFKQALQKGIRSLETGHAGFGFNANMPPHGIGEIEELLRRPNPLRIHVIFEAFERDFSLEKIQKLTHISTWFLQQMRQIYLAGKRFQLPDGEPAQQIEAKNQLFRAKQYGFTDAQLAVISGNKEEAITAIRQKMEMEPVYKLVDTCAGEFEAYTPYYYSGYESEDEANPSAKPKIMVIGGGPNRIGQGIEFDYCCVHAAMTCRELGYECIMVNSNPETVSTDYDISDKLYFEPLTPEDVLHICRREQPQGVIVQFGGQTPLKLAPYLQAAGIPIIGTQPQVIETAENRGAFRKLAQQLGILQPSNAAAQNAGQGMDLAHQIGYPVIVRPSHVLGGARMRVIYNAGELERYFEEPQLEFPVLIESFLENAIEVDVDAIADGEQCVIAGIMEHVHEAGIHSGDSACILPVYTLAPSMVEQIERNTQKLALALKVKGLVNIQFAVKNDLLYVIEVNPRASRTVPFVSKATGIAWAKLATRITLGETIAQLQKFLKPLLQPPDVFAVKEPIFPFNRFEQCEVLLGPEMKSTGEVMCSAPTAALAYKKAQEAVYRPLPKSGHVYMYADEAWLLRLQKKEKEQEKMLLNAISQLQSTGFTVSANPALARWGKDKGSLKLEALMPKIGEEQVKTGTINMVCHLPLTSGGAALRQLRRTTYDAGLPLTIGLRAALLAVEIFLRVR